MQRPWKCWPGLGMVEEVIEKGYVEPLFRIWDRQSKKLIAEFDFGILKDETPYPFAVQCEQHKLAAMALRRLRDYPNATVEFSARVTSLEQFADHVEITVEGAEGSRKFAGSYLIGMTAAAPPCARGSASSSQATPIPNAS